MYFDTRFSDHLAERKMERKIEKAGKCVLTQSETVFGFATLKKNSFYHLIYINLNPSDYPIHILVKVKPPEETKNTWNWK